MKTFFALLFCLVGIQAFAQYGDGRYTFVFLHTNLERAELPSAQVDSLQAGHLKNINRLIKEQKMIAAGPFHNGGGIFLFDTDLEETQSILRSDPAIAAGRYEIETFPADMIRNSFLKGQVCPLWDKDESEVEMVTYYFVYYKTDRANESAAATKTNRFTEDVLRKVVQKHGPNAIIGVINLNQNEGQVILYTSDQGGWEEEFAQHELVKNGLMSWEHKQIYFPKGVFCEK